LCSDLSAASYPTTYSISTPGGRALKFYASVRLDVRKIDNLKDGAEAIGSRVRVKVVKNKLAPPFRLAEFDIVYGKGISKEGSLLDVGVAAEIVKKSGSWFTYEGDQLGQGKEKAREFLLEHKDIAMEIDRRVREAVAAVPGLAVCGAAYDGVGLPACIASGVQAATRVVASLRGRETIRA